MIIRFTRKPQCELEKKIPGNRNDAAIRQANHALTQQMREGPNHDLAQRLVRQMLEGGDIPDGVTDFVRTQARKAAATEGAVHAYGDNIPPAIKRRIG